MPFHRYVFSFLALSFLAFCLLPPVAFAQQTPTQTPEQRQAENEAAGKAAQAASIHGPSDIKLGDKGILHLPAGMDWVPRAESDRYMRSLGQRPDPQLLGLVTGSTAGNSWLAIMRFTGEGYVKDDDAKDLDAAKLLASLREGQDEANKSRVQRGFPRLILDDWFQAPSYDADKKHLVWALPVRTDDPNSKPTINYNTRALGREGYFSLNLLTDKEHFEAEKGTAVTLLKSIEYTPGHRYADFNPSTDKVAAYGLAALVGAVALKKLGLIAIATAFVVKFAKIIAVAAIGLLAGLKAFFSRRKSKTDA